MSFIRPAAAFTRQANQARIPFTRQFNTLRPFSSTARITVQGYGDGKGDPKGDNPQQQGGSSAVTQNMEHPGPTPPSEGKNTGGATKAGADSTSGTKDPSEASAKSGGSRSKEAKETGSSPTGGNVGGGESTSHEAGNKARPMISNMNKPGASNSKERQAEVEQHNREFELRQVRAPPAEDDKVDKKFWQGKSISPLCL